MSWKNVQYQNGKMRTSEGGGGGSSGHDYSTTEQVVGTWIDGKPVYEIVIHNNGEPLPANNDVSSLHIDRLIYADALMADYANRNYSRSLLSNAGGLNSRFMYMPDQNTLVRNGSYYAFEIIIRYTKTTD